MPKHDPLTGLRPDLAALLTAPPTKAERDAARRRMAPRSKAQNQTPKTPPHPNPSGTPTRHRPVPSLPGKPSRTAYAHLAAAGGAVPAAQPTVRAAGSIAAKMLEVGRKTGCVHPAAGQGGSGLPERPSPARAAQRRATAPAMLAAARKAGLLRC